MLSGISGAASALSAIPGPVGAFASAISVASSAVHGFIDAVSGYADKFAPYSGQIMLAQAQADFREQLGDMRRAQQMGPELANFIRAKSDLDQSWEDVKMAFMQKAIPALTNILGGINSLLNFVNGLGFTSKDTDPQNWLDAVKALPGVTKEQLEQIKKIEANTRPRPEDQADFFRQLTELKAPATPVMQPGFIDPALNMPVFRGF